MKKSILYLFVTLIILACGSTQKINEEDFSTFKTNLQEKNIEVVFEWAQPTGLASVQGIDRLLINGSNQNNINLIGNTNFFKIRKDSLEIELPYFGENQISAPLSGNNIGISFEGIPKTNSIEFKDEKKKAILKYDVTTTNDNYNIILTLFPNNSSFMSVTSDRRTPINYNGNWRFVEGKQKINQNK